MSELVEFVLARVADREAEARAVADLEPSYGHYGATAVAEVAKLADHQGARSAACSYVARVADPARVLARCASDLLIVELHDIRHPELLDDGWEPTCATCEDGHEPELWPCATLRALAAVDADHEDFREEWAL